MEMKTVLEDYDKNPDEEIPLLVEAAKQKLEKIDSEVKGKKKPIIIELAKSFGGKIKDEDISKEIVHHLSDQVSERFIRECLPEKYKQKYRVKNAKKQKQKKDIKIDEKLAVPPTPLNPEIRIEEENEEENKGEKKQMMLVSANGNISIQNDGNSESDSSLESQLENNSFKASVYRQQLQSLQEEKKEDEEELSNYKELQSENLALNEDDDKPSQLVIAENKEVSEDKNDIATDNDNLDFEFSMQFGKIREYMKPLYSKLGDTGPVWFQGTINKKTAKVVYSNLGRKVK